MDRRAVGDAVARAMREQRVEVLFQPQFSVGDNRLVGAEALARWQPGDGSGEGAEALFAAARREGVVTALSAHVQDVALAHAARWRAADGEPLRLALNVVGEELNASDYADTLLRRMAGAGIAPGRVTVEITEQGAIGQLDRAASTLARLREAGVAVALDDFGTGYSGLAWLKALPIDAIKLDAGMTRDLLGDARARTVVRSITALARDLGLAIVAEGVETEAQLAAVRAEGCAVYQGFLRAGPVAAAVFARDIAV